jgi:hypothetical protein
MPARFRALQKPFQREEHGACGLAATKRGKRPRILAGTRAANLFGGTTKLGGTGFPPAGLWGVSSRRLEDDARYAKVFLIFR